MLAILAMTASDWGLLAGVLVGLVVGAFFVVPRIPGLRRKDHRTRGLCGRPTIQVNGQPVPDDAFDFDPETGEVVFDRAKFAFPATPNQIQIQYAYEGAPCLNTLRAARATGGHPASGRFCPWCGVDKDNATPCARDVSHGTTEVAYCHICGAGPGDSCDAGLHS